MQMCISPWIQENDFQWDTSTQTVPDIYINIFNENGSKKSLNQQNVNTKIIEFIRSERATVIFHSKESVV